MPSPLTRKTWQDPDAFAHAPASPAQKQRTDTMFTSHGQDISLHLLSHEGILPSQWYAHAALRSPEHALLHAVFLDAHNTLLKQGNMDIHKARRLYAEAWAWFWSDDQSWPFAFVPICHHLGFDPDGIRRGLAARFTATGQRAGVVLGVITQQAGPAPHVGTDTKNRVNRGYGRRRSSIQ